MGETVWSQFSDAAMRQALRGRGEVVYLRDEHFPMLRLRSHLGGESGAWEVRHLSRWRKGGSWPQTGALDMLAALPGVSASLAAGCEAAPRVGVLRTVGDLLNWYGARLARAPGLVPATKGAVRSVCGVWLERLRPLTLAGLTVDDVDRVLIQPMRDAGRAPATIHKAYRALRRAMHAARKLGLMQGDPLAGVIWSDFGAGRLRARQGRLHPQDIPALLECLRKCWPRRRAAGVLLLLMLAHGTRIGETRQAKWSDFDLDAGWWVIPAVTTKMRREHELPLTPEVVRVLRHYRAYQTRHGSEYLFPGRRGLPISHEQAGKWVRGVSCGAWSAHDLRKLARGCWQLLGVDSEVSERLLAHQPSDLVSAYVQVDWRGLKREALEGWHGVGNVRVAGLTLRDVVDGLR